MAEDWIANAYKEMSRRQFVAMTAKGIGLAGFALAALSLVMIFVVIVQKLMFPELPRGWASTIATILFIGGIQTLCIGMVGEYLGRTYLKLNRKRQFVIGSTTWRKTGPDA